jgi:hypothetical protein
MNLQEINQSLQAITGNPEYSVMEAGSTNSNTLKGVAEVNRLLEGATRGDRFARIALQEAMTTADFPNLFGYALSRDLQALYNDFPFSFDSMSRRVDLPDFRNREWYPHDAMDQVLTADSDDGAPAASRRNKTDPTATTWNVDLYQTSTELTFRTLVNDDLGFFTTVPREFARACRKTEQKVFSQTHWNASGPTGLTQITGNPALTVANLKTAIAQMLKAVDANGEPIYVEAPILEVGPDLYITAQEIVNATVLEINTGTTTTGIGQTANWSNSFIGNVVVNPWIPIIASSNSATSWCLLANSSQGPAAFEHGWLSGMQGPQILMKAPNAQRVGGGIDARFGDITTLSTEYKCIDVFGAKLIDSKLGFMSNGSGS